MKSFLLSVLPLVASAAVVAPRAPQTATIDPNSPFGPLAGLLKGSNGTAGGVGAALIKALPKAKLAKVTSVPPKLRPGAKRIVASYGPYVLLGRGQTKPKTLVNSLDPTGQAFMDIITDGLCTNCTILTGGTRTVFEDGSDAGPPQGVYIHRVISIDVSKAPNLPISKCGLNQTKIPRALAMGSEFLAQGDDSASGGQIFFTSEDGKYNSGFFVGATDKIMNQVDLVNYNADTKNVYVNYEIEYVDGHVGSDASAVLMSVVGCQDTSGVKNEHAEHGMSMPGIKLNKTGIAITESPHFPISKDGKIVAAMGHMHDGGSAMVLYINGKEVCTSNAVYGKGGESTGDTITNMSNCEKNIPVKKGDVLTMNSVYDLKTHPLRSGAEHNAMGNADVMGMFYLTIAVDGTESTKL